MEGSLHYTVFLTPREPFLPRWGWKRSRDKILSITLDGVSIVSTEGSGKNVLGTIVKKGKRRLYPNPALSFD